MDRLITLWHNLTTEQLVIALLIGAVFYLFIEVKTLRGKYASLDKGHSNHAWIIALTTGVLPIRNHHTGDYELRDPLDENFITELARKILNDKKSP